MKTKNSLRLALENEAKAKSQKETELVIYCKIGNFQGLKEALKKERHDQYQIRSKCLKTGIEGCVRVRKTQSSEGVTFVLTNKVKTDSKVAAVSDEFDTTITEEHFNAFASICPDKCIKDRYIFISKNVTFKTVHGEATVVVPELKYEVDVFPKEDGTLNEWCKIDIEVDSILSYLEANKIEVSKLKLNISVSHLPFKPSESFIAANANEEQVKILDYFYKHIFSVPN